MADIKESSKGVQRVHLHRVEIDTPALLNLVKHCREADVRSGARGSVMGVLKESLDGQTLLIT